MSLTWSAITILPQIVDLKTNLDGINWIWLFFERFFFILSITLMFDVRDLHHDPEKLHTFPQSIGVIKTKWMSVFFLVIASIGLINLDLGFNQLLGIAFVYLLTLFMIYRSQPDRDDVFYTGWFDGVIGLHALVIIGFSFWP